MQKICFHFEMSRILFLFLLLTPLIISHTLNHCHQKEFSLLSSFSFQIQSFEGETLYGDAPGTTSGEC